MKQSADERGETAGRLFDEHGARVYRFCYRLCGNEQDAEDLTMETFASAVDALARFDGRSTELAFLFGICLKKWKAQLRSRAIRERLLPWVVTARGRDMAKLVDVDLAIDGLSTKLREAFVLVKVEGLTHDEAAQVLRLPMGTVQARVFEAIRLLRKALADPESVPRPIVAAEEACP